MLTSSITISFDAKWFNLCFPRSFLSPLFSVLVTYLHEVHGVYMPPNEHWFCSIQVFMFYSSYMCSTYLMITMTFERFFSITRPLEAASFNTLTRAKITIVLIFLFGFTYSIPFLFIGANNGRTCIPNAIISSNSFGAIYYYLTEIVTLVIPFVSLLVMNSVIIHTLRKRSKTSISKSIGQGQIEGQNVKIKQSEKQIYTMLLVLTFMFLVLSIPVTLLIFYVNFYTGNTPYYFASLHLFYQFGQKTHATNHGINFFLYVISGRKFRMDLRNLLCARNNENFPPRVNTKRTSTTTLNNQVRLR